MSINVEKKEPRINEEELRRHLTKFAKEVKIKDALLEGKEVNKRKPRGKIVKGGNNYFVGRSLGHKYG